LYECVQTYIYNIHIYSSMHTYIRIHTEKHTFKLALLNRDRFCSEGFILSRFFILLKFGGPRCVAGGQNSVTYFMDGLWFTIKAELIGRGEGQAPNGQTGKQWRRPGAVFGVGGRKNVSRTKISEWRFFRHKFPFSRPKFFLVIDQVFRIFPFFSQIFRIFYYVQSRIRPFPHKNNHYFRKNSFMTPF